MYPSGVPVLYPLRSVDSASVRYSELAHGRRRITIDHRPLAGVTPAMLLDWFSHLGDTMTYGGRTVDRYLAWHPIDHIRCELWRPAPAGGAAEGARFHIFEAYGGRPEFGVDAIDRVEKLDLTGIRLVQRWAGAPILALEHTWSAAADGAHYVSVLELGVGSRLGRPANRLMRRLFPAAKAQAWVRHTVEEVGQLEHLLPDLGVR